MDPAAWCRQVHPGLEIVVNEFGSHVVFFPGLVRGEYHFAAAGDLESVRTWPARSAPVERMLIVDRSGRLRQALEVLPEAATPPVSAEDIRTLCGRFANWLLLAHHVAARGEFLRAADALSHVQRHLQWMARLALGRTEHWFVPSRGAEEDLPRAEVEALHRATSSARPEEIREALAAAWLCGRRHWGELCASPPRGLWAELDAELTPGVPDDHLEPNG